MRRKTIAKFIVVLFFNVHVAMAQTVEPKGVFLQDSTKIGEQIQFALSVKYDRNLDILFPDSLYRFGTFEYISREYHPTVTDSTYSYDSVIYQLSTFEIDSVQFLQLPVYAIHNDDSLAIYSNMDSIILIQVITEMPENPKLKENTELVEIRKSFNYPYLLIALGILIFIGLVVLLFFGKQLVRAWRIFMLKRSHKKFIERFFRLMRDISGGNPTNTPEQVLAVWKRYLEKLEKKPVSKLTTKEILVLHNNSDLKEHLRIIDRNIYGGEKTKDLFGSFDYLMRFSVDVYNDRIREIKNS